MGAPLSEPCINTLFSPLVVYLPRGFLHRLERSVFSCCSARRVCVCACFSFLFSKCDTMGSFRVWKRGQNGLIKRRLKSRRQHKGHTRDSGCRCEASAIVYPRSYINNKTHFADRYSNNMLIFSLHAYKILWRSISLEDCCEGRSICGTCLGGVTQCERAISTGLPTGPVLSSTTSTQQPSWHRCFLISTSIQSLILTAFDDRPLGIMPHDRIAIMHRNSCAKRCGAVT